MPVPQRTLFGVFLIGFWLLWVPPTLLAQEEETATAIMKGMMSSFSLPLRDLLKKEHPSERWFHDLLVVEVVTYRG